MSAAFEAGCCRASSRLNPCPDFLRIGLVFEIGRFERHHVNHDDAPEVIKQMQCINRREMNKRRGVG
jgi:hypothetical protein